VHFIQRELMPIDLFFYEMHDHPEAMARLASQLEGYWQRVEEAACQCQAEVFLVGANYDSMITYPPFFREAMSDRDFGRHLDCLFEDIGRGDHLILGISDTTPPRADFRRLLEIARRVEAFGPVRGPS